MSPAAILGALWRLFLSFRGNFFVALMDGLILERRNRLVRPSAWLLAYSLSCLNGLAWRLTSNFGFG
jgi:hypothetical protein